MRASVFRSRRSSSQRACCCPDLTLADLQPGGTGIRAKLHGPDETFADFLIERDASNERVIQVAGIESPGLTSCLAIGEMVASLWNGSS